jgi:hypothetical protein
MFNKGQIVRLKTPDGNGDMLEVVADSSEHKGITETVDSYENQTFHDTGDLELVTSDLKTHKESGPMQPNVSQELIDKSREQIHEDIEKMFAQAVIYATTQTDRGVELEIKVNVPGSHTGNKIEIIYEATVGYEQSVQSDNIFKSLKIALQRAEVDAELRPKMIELYK